jgi:hypothetical protein
MLLSVKHHFVGIVIIYFICIGYCTADNTILCVCCVSSAIWTITTWMMATLNVELNLDFLWLINKIRLSLIIIEN